MAAAAVSTRRRRSTHTHEAYTVRVANWRVVALVTANRGCARRWISTTRWINGGRIRSGRLVVGLGVQWTPSGRPLGGALPHPDTLQLCVGHRCLVFHLACADALPLALGRFLADPRITFVGSGNAYDGRLLSAHYCLHVASGRELRALAGMGNASMEDMADRLLGYPGIEKPAAVAMSSWDWAPLSPEQVEYATVDAHIAFRLGVHLCPAGGREPQRAPIPRARAQPQQHYAFFVSAADEADSGPAAAAGTPYWETETEYDGELRQVGYLSRFPVTHPSGGSDDDDSSWDKLERIGCGAAAGDDDDDSEDGYGDHAVGLRTFGDDDFELEEDGYFVSYNEIL